jgi:hypothetical protein
VDVIVTVEGRTANTVQVAIQQKEKVKGQQAPIRNGGTAAFRDHL